MARAVFIHLMVIPNGETPAGLTPSEIKDALHPFADKLEAQHAFVGFSINSLPDMGTNVVQNFYKMNRQQILDEVRTTGGEEVPEEERPKMVRVQHGQEAYLMDPRDADSDNIVLGDN